MMKTNVLKVVQETISALKQPVRVLLFTRDVNCDICPSALELARAIRSVPSRLVALELYDSVMDRDKTTEYGIERVPTWVVQGQGGRTVRFSGTIEGLSLFLLLDAIEGVARGRQWFPGGITETLSLMEHPVAVKVYVENDCTLCRPVAETAMGLSLTNRQVTAEVIVADDFPELLSKHRIRVLPYLQFGPTLHAEGHLDESMFLELLFKAQGMVQEKKCIVCGAPSGETICNGCRTKIQAEAVGHKRREEQFHRTGSVVDSRRKP